MRGLRKIALLPFFVIALQTLAAPQPEQPPGLERVGHIVVIFLENRSFDHLYGLFPGADGLGDARRLGDQITPDGDRFEVLPAVLNNYTSSWVDTRFAVGLPNEPFREDHFVDLRDRTGDPVHRFYQEQEQINGGKMNQFVAFSDVGGLPMGQNELLRPADLGIGAEGRALAAACSALLDEDLSETRKELVAALTEGDWLGFSHGAEAEIDGARRQMPGFEVYAIPEDNGLAEG